MREILFRGKNIDLEWVEGDLLSNGVDYKTAIRENKEGLVERVISHTVGQYTGLTDKNGKKIFEGDIHERDGHCFVIEHGRFWRFDNSDFAYGWHFRAIKDDACEEFYGDEEDYVNVIGNIHDNPELLKGGE